LFKPDIKMTSGLFPAGKAVSLPLKSISVQVDVLEHIAGIEGQLIYFNDGEEPVEVLFRTPTDSACAIVALEATIDGRKLRAEIFEKEEARHIYDDAIAEGRTAVFGEEKSADVFCIALGNLPPKTCAKVTLTMVSELAYEEDGSLRFSLPVVLKPRYGPPSMQERVQNIMSSSWNQSTRSAVVTSYSFHMTISEAHKVTKVTSPTCSLVTAVQVLENYVDVSLPEAHNVEDDVVIHIHLQKPSVHKVLVEKGDPSATSEFLKAALISFSVCPQIEIPQQVCELNFIVDCSGSMSGSPIKMASQALQLFIKSIPEGSYFNIVCFGSHYKALFHSSVPYNEKNVQLAMECAANLGNMGGTNILQPLEHVLSQGLSPIVSRQVFLLTDGAVNNTNEVISLMYAYSHSARSVCFVYEYYVLCTSCSPLTSCTVQKMP
jgi:hypothetical protein